MDDKPYLALCECGADTIQIHLYVEPAEDFAGYVSFSSWWNQHRPWRDRLSAVWQILRGKEYYFSEVILDREDTERLHWYLASRLQQNLTFTIPPTDHTGTAGHWGHT